jgi:hypothetical protein
MKLSPETVEILKNFSTINPSIMLRKGDVIRTITAKKNVLALAKVKDSFPQDFGIYDITHFLNVISCVDSNASNVAVEFDGDIVHFRSGKTRNHFRAAAASTIAQPPAKDIEIPSPDAVVTLPSDVVTQIMRAASILPSPNVVLWGKDGTSYFSAYNVIDESSLRQDTEIGTCEKDFIAVFDTQLFKILPRDYTVKVTSGVSHFVSTAGDVEYWIACSVPKK